MKNKKKKGKIFALILARGGSKRIKNKNLSPFLGKPLIYLTLQKIKKIKIFDKYFVSSNSANIIKTIKKFKDFQVLKRSKKNSSDKAKTSDVLSECLNHHLIRNKYKYCCIFYATSIFIKKKDIVESFKNFKKRKLSSFMPIIESDIQENKVLSINRKNKKIIFKKNFNKNYDIKNKCYIDAGQWYLISIKEFIKERKILMKNSGYIILNNQKVHDINFPIDLKIAKIKYLNK
jgi:CMP-N-acetylneuraminic acid synthetase